MFTISDMQTATYVALSKVPDILKKADNADVAARDHRELMYLLQRISYANSRLAGHIITRKTAYTSFEWNIESDDEKLVQRMKPFVKAILENYINAPLYGVMGFQCMWAQTPELGWQLANAKKYKAIELDFEADSLLIVNQDDNTKKEIKPDTTDYFYYIYPNPDRGGLLRSVIIPEILRHETITEWRNLNQRMKGIVAATVDAEKLARAEELLNLSEAQKNAMLTDLKAAMAAVGTNSWMMNMNVADVQFKSLVEGTAGSSYKAFKNELDADISIAILGQANTAELPAGGGSRAALQVLNLIRQDILLNDMLNIKDLVDRALIIDAKKNIEANAVSVPYEFKWKFDENVDIEAYARVFETIGRSSTPIVVDKNEYYNKLGLSVPKEDAETITIGGETTGL